MPVVAHEMKRCVAITILLINRIAASVEQERRDLQTPAAAREMKRGPARNDIATEMILPISRTGASVEQERRELQMSCDAREVKRGVAITDVLLIDRSAASVEQERRDLQIPVFAREMKRGLAITILRINRIAASVEQERRDVQTPTAAREMKRGVAFSILLINRSAASVEQERRDVQTPFAAREVKRGVDIIDAVKRHPSIKVQRAYRHVTSLRRSKQPSLADLTASLTQRNNAEATGVRHHVQAHGVLQRNDPLVVVESTSADRHVEPFGAQLRQSLDDGFLQRPKGPARFPNLDVRPATHAVTCMRCVRW